VEVISDVLGPISKKIQISQIMFHIQACSFMVTRHARTNNLWCKKPRFFFFSK